MPTVNSHQAQRIGGRICFGRIARGNVSTESLVNVSKRSTIHGYQVTPPDDKYAQRGASRPLYKTELL